MTPINRRAVLAGGAATAVSACASMPAAVPTGELPNILWLVSEDNNPFIGAYGDALACTPNIDALAARGVLYRNAYCNTPVCAPTRFTILTGVNAESCSPANHMRAEAHLPSVLRTYPEYLRSAGYYCTNNVKTDYNCDVEPERIWNESGSEAHWRNRPAGQPFMAVFNSMTTHESTLFRTQDLGADPDAIELPAYLPDTPEIRSDYSKYYGLMQQMDSEIGMRLAELEAAGLADDTIVFYYSDNGGVLPRSKRYCYDEGMRCALIVHVPEKWRHLAPAAQGTEIDAPVSFVDLAPTLLSIAGIVPPSTMQGNPLLGQHISEAGRFAFGARGRMDERYDFVRTVTDGQFRYIRNYMPHRPAGQVQAFAWLAPGYQSWHRRYLDGQLDPVERRFFEPRDHEELYDLASDPDQVINLADEASYARQLETLSKALDAHMLAINDNGFIPEGGSAEGWDASRAQGGYPLADLMKVGRLAASRDASQLPNLMQALASGDETTRYWGATGLLILGPQAAPAGEALARAMRSDPSPQVRVVAAEAAAELGFDREAATILGGLLGGHDDARVRLQAINALTYIGDAARGALPQIAEAAVSDDEFLRNAGRYLVAVLEGDFDPSMQIFDVPRMLREMRRGAGPA
ncbi:sulfatase-like hydrolase/transferase [Aurantiacibacter odishensis]|uniref:sulfatase-like hydrolase/transferase n=1 Tax=Aurantiacibacter odishensis TaxID=1155476 RepID=UPI000E75C950|nr:sulfatase-like hydrolase/transferase [Aurantiacibacter odishensis]